MSLLYYGYLVSCRLKCEGWRIPRWLLANTHTSITLGVGLNRSISVVSRRDLTNPEVISACMHPIIEVTIECALSSNLGLMPVLCSVITCQSAFEYNNDVTYYVITCKSPFDWVYTEQWYVIITSDVTWTE